MKKRCLLLFFSCLFLLGGGCSPKNEFVQADDWIGTVQGSLLPAEVIDLTNWKVTLPIVPTKMEKPTKSNNHSWLPTGMLLISIPIRLMIT